MSSPLDQRHPLYVAMLPKWTYYRDHYEGGPDYCAKDNPLPTASPQVPAGRTQQGAFGTKYYLWQYPLEKNDRFQHRLARAVCINVVAPVVDLYASTVGKQENILLDPKGLDEFVDNCDQQGQSLLQFLSGCRVNAAVAGHTFILVDSPNYTEAPVTERDVRERGIRPYLVEIRPEAMLNWRIGSDGLPDEILYQTSLEVPGSVLNASGEDAEEVQLRYWNRKEWRVYRKVKDEYVMLSNGVNSLGVIPVVPLYHKRLRAFQGESLLKDAARIMQLMTNWVSGLDEAMEAQMFAVPVIKSRKTPDEIGVGISVALHLNPEDNEDFKYVAPDTAPFESGWDAFYRMLQLALRHMGIKPSPISNDTLDQQSGVAKAWDWYEAEKVLAAMALHEQEAVKMIFDYAGRWSGKQWSGQVQYPGKFDLSTLSQDVSSLLQLQTAGATPTIRRELMRRIAQKALPSVSDEIRGVIERELESYPAPEPMLPAEAE